MANDNPRARLAELKERWDADPTSRLFLQLAEEYRRQGMPREALSVLDEGLKVHPPTGAAQVVLGRCQLDAGDIPAALNTLEQVVLRDPTQMVAYRALVDGYIQKRDAVKAKERLGLYAQLNPQDPEIEELSERIQRLDVALEPETTETVSGGSTSDGGTGAPPPQSENRAAVPPPLVVPSRETPAGFDPGATVQVPSLSPDEAAALAESHGQTGADEIDTASTEVANSLTTAPVDLPADEAGHAIELPELPDLHEATDLPSEPESGADSAAVLPSDQRPEALAPSEPPEDVPLPDFAETPLDTAPVPALELPEFGSEISLEPREDDGVLGTADAERADKEITGTETPATETPATGTSATETSATETTGADNTEDVRERWGRPEQVPAAEISESSAPPSVDEQVDADKSETASVSKTLDGATSQDDDPESESSSPVPWSLPDAIAAEAASIDTPDLPKSNIELSGAVADDVTSAESEGRSTSGDEPAEAPTDVLADAPELLSEASEEASLHEAELNESGVGPQETGSALGDSHDAEAADTEAELDASDGAYAGDVADAPDETAEPESSEQAAEGLEEDTDDRPSGAGLAAATGLFGSLGLGMAAKKAAASAETAALGSRGPEAGEQQDSVEEPVASDQLADDQPADGQPADVRSADSLSTGDQVEKDPSNEPELAVDEEEHEPWIAPALDVELADGGNGVVFLLDSGRLPPMANLALVPTRPLRRRPSLTVPGDAEEGSTAPAPLEEEAPSPALSGDSDRLADDSDVASDSAELQDEGPSGAGLAVGAGAVAAGTATLANLYRQQGHTEDAVRVMSALREDDGPELMASELLDGAEDGAGLSSRKATMLHAYLERLGKGT